jgi:hypothetical protein
VFRRTPAPLVEAVLAGDTVDWQQAVVRYGRNAADIERLRALSAIAQQSRLTTPARRQPSLHPLKRQPFIAAITLLAALQIADALYGYFAGAGRLESIPVGGAIATVGVFTTASILLLSGGRHDDRAVSLGVFFLLIANAFCRRFVFHLIPVAVLVDGVYPDAFLAALFWDFVRRFPRTSRLDRVDRLCGLMVALAWAIGAGLFVSNALLAHGATFIPTAIQRSSPVGLYWILVLGVVLPAPVITILKTRRAAPSEQRRVAILALGLAVILAPLTLETVAEASIPSFAAWMARTNVRAAASPFFFGLLLGVPVVTTYAVMVRAALDVRFIVGKALQYALARNSARALALIPICTLLAFAYLHRQQTVEQLVADGRGVLIGAALSLAVFTTIMRERALTFVDAWFLRDRIDLTAELTTLTGRIAASRSDAEVAHVVQEDLVRVLRVKRAAVLMRNDGGDLVPVFGDSARLRPGSALVAMLAADRGAFTLRTSATNSLVSLLPYDEQVWLKLTATEALVPLMDGRDVMFGAIAVGPKLNEDVLSREELSLMTTAASASAMALVHWRARERAQPAGPLDDLEPAAECTQCGKIDTTNSVFCQCGGPKRIASVPKVLASKFDVQRYVGAGGMGVVYCAIDQKLGRSVALKTLSRISGKAVHSLTREARIMAAVGHPNLATIYGVEVWRETPILVLEFLEGGSLVARLGKPQPLRDILRLGALLAPALEQLHEAGILHGDIKPSNVAFSREGVPKLLDFGIAQLLSEATGDGRQFHTSTTHSGTTTTHMFVARDSTVLAGTPLYMSPERVRGSPATVAVDLWSFALLLYEAIAGMHPFSAGDVTKVLEKVRAGRIPDLRAVRSDCPQVVAEAFHVWLAVDPSRRPHTASEFRRQIDQLLAQIGDAGANAVQIRGPAR